MIHPTTSYFRFTLSNFYFLISNFDKKYFP